MTSKSPFFVVQNFLSPLMCESIISSLNNDFPNYVDNKPIKTVSINKLLEIRLEPILDKLATEQLESYYGFKYKGLFELSFEWFVENCAVEPVRCENEALINGNWVRTDEKDFTGIIFLNDYNDSPNFDTDYEVYGGKLQFPNHNFSFTPKRGTLVVFPSENRFSNNTSKVLAGELNQIRFHIAATEPYQYDMKKFPGNYTTWFN